MTNLQSAIHHVRAHKNIILDELRELASIASISALSEHRPDIEQAAEWLANTLQSMDIDNVQIMPTDGNPVVYAESLPAGEDKPTVLIYGHYDVQPVDPLDEWETPPFEPTMRDDNLYARGASDMKAQIIATLAALAALRQHGGGIPVNVKLLIEGEEEIGSPNLGKFVAENKELLAADFSLNPDAMILQPDLPALVYGLRGLAYFELRVQGPESDLHSGIFGGAVHNPAQVMSELIAGMHDADGRITLPGFYDKVRPLSEDERSALARLPMDDEQLAAMAANPPALFGEAGYTNVERIGARPTLEINGLISGFTGEGAKTVLPARAMAKISARLVPDQDPDEVHQQLRAYLEQHAPPTVHWELTQMAAGRAVLVERDSPEVQAAHKALHTVFGVEPVYRREGGSIPIVSIIQDILGIDTVFMGFALPDDGLHAPNEHVHLPTFYRGIEAHMHFFANLAVAQGSTNEY